MEPVTPWATTNEGPNASVAPREPISVARVQIEGSLCRDFRNRVGRISIWGHQQITLGVMIEPQESPRPVGL